MKAHRSEALGERVLCTQLDSGLEVWVCPMAGMATRTAYFGTRFGSNQVRFRRDGVERTTPAGTAHFLEHQLFEGDTPVFDRFAALDASCNAFTSFETTVYTFSCADAAAFDSGWELLIDFVQHPSITEESVEKERGIIIEEVKMYRDNPEWRVHFDCLEALFGDHPVSVPPGGTTESVEAITRADLIDAWEAHYRPEHMFALVVGDVDPEAVVDTIRSALDPPEGGPAEAIELSPAAGVSVPEVRGRHDVSRPRVCIGWRDNGAVGRGSDVLRQRVAVGMGMDLILGESSDAWLSLYRDGLLDHSFGVSTSGGTDWCATIAGGECDQPDDLVAAVSEVAAAAVDGGLERDAFERARRKWLGSGVRSFAGPASAAGSLLGCLTEQASPFATHEAALDLGQAEVEAALARHLDPACRTVAILEPAG